MLPYNCIYMILMLSTVTTYLHNLFIFGQVLIYIIFNTLDVAKVKYLLNNTKFSSTIKHRL